MCFLISPRLEVWRGGLVWRIDFSHMVALLCEVENTSGVDACLFHSAAALTPFPPLSSTSSPFASSFPTLHTVPLSLTLPFLPSSFLPSFLRAAGARGLGDGFHGYWLQRLDASSQLPVVVRLQPDMSSYQSGFFFSDLQLYIFFTTLFLLLLSSCLKIFIITLRVSFLAHHLHLLLAFSSLICSLVILLFLPALCQHSQVWQQPQLIQVHWDNNYSSSNQPQLKSTCWMPSAALINNPIRKSVQDGGINLAQNAFTEHGLQGNQKRNI